MGLRPRASPGSRQPRVLRDVDNGGHYVYNEGSACADRATADFLANGHLPDKDVFCTDVAQH